VAVVIEENDTNNLILEKPEFPNDAAFYLRFMMDIGGLKDTDGRRLHEVDYRDEMGADEYKICSFKDNRNGYLMNESAFKQMGEYWENTLAVASALSGFVTRNDSNVTNPLNRAWKASLYGMFLPVYINKRMESSQRGKPIEVAISSFFKINLDLPTTLDLIYLDANLHEMYSGLEPIEFANNIAEFANENGILINNEYACAGPGKLITRYVECISKDDNLIANPQCLCDSLNHNYVKFANIMIARYVIGYWFGLMSGVFSLHVIFKNSSTDCNKKNTGYSAYARRRLFALQRVIHSGSAENAMSNYRGLFQYGNQADNYVIDYFANILSLHPGNKDKFNYQKCQNKLEEFTNSYIRELNVLLSEFISNDDLGLVKFDCFWPNLPRNMV